VSPGPRADQTVIARSPLADQPTQMHGRLPAEHVDPYTAPGRHNGAGAYGAPGGHSGGGYGGTATSGYAGGYGAPGQPADPYADPYGQAPRGQYDGYGQPGYPPQQGYDPRSGRPADRRLDWMDD
jgi:hypothetical protein